MGQRAHRRAVADVGRTEDTDRRRKRCPLRRRRGTSCTPSAARLFAVPFDVRAAGGDRRTRADRRGRQPIRGSGTTGAAHFSFSHTGSLDLHPWPGREPLRGQLEIALTDRKGAIEPLKLPPGLYASPRASPDGTRIAFGTDDGKESIIWIYDLSGTSAMQRLTFGGNNRFPIWTSDSKRVAFQSDRDGDLAIFWQPADGTGTAERLTKPGSGRVACAGVMVSEGRHACCSA